MVQILLRVIMEVVIQQLNHQLFVMHLEQVHLLQLHNQLQVMVNLVQLVLQMEEYLELQMPM